MENYKFNFIKENGEEIECEKVLSFRSKKNNKFYILFTDNKENLEGKLNLYPYYLKNDDDTLCPIEDELELDMVRNVYDKIRGEI